MRFTDRFDKFVIPGYPHPKNFDISECIPDVYIQIGMFSIWMFKILAFTYKLTKEDYELKNINLFFAELI